MIDIDDFKGINDKFGHAEGDRALESAATVLKKTLHHNDFLARYTKDEFVAVVELDSPAGLESLTARVRSRFSLLNASRGEPYNIAVSLGGAYAEASEMTEPEELLRRADEEMYREKREKGLRGKK
jgi:diguanylate cyclase (GGDEF)-like protein